MKTRFKIQDSEDGKLIRLSSPYTRTRALNFFYALNFLFVSVMFCYILFNRGNGSVLLTLVSLLFIVAFSIGFYRFINKATETEKLFINKQQLDLIVTSLLNVTKRSFLLSDISDFKFLEKERYEPHPLGGQSFDYLGFQTEQQVIQDLHSEGRVSFIYHGRQIRFGKELTSWEFNELEVLLYDLTGNDLRYTDEYEQEHFPKSGFEQ